MLAMFVALAISVLVLLLTQCDVGKTQTRTQEDCEVDVASPWQENTYVPQNSSIHMTCTGERNQVLYWSIQLADSETDTQFDYPSSISMLNGHSIYEIDIDIPDTIGLLINNTEGNNASIIQCVDGNTVTTISQTTLIIISELYYLDISVEDIPYQSRINISWTTFQSTVVDSYKLNASSNTQRNLSFLVHEPYFVFTAPEDAPLCDIYNFSVTATYVGATYTGAGCSVPSPVLSKMLPSLPDATGLKSSLNYMLEKNITEIGITLILFIMPFNYFCEEYPVKNHTLEITKIKPLSDVLLYSSMTLVSTEDVTFTTTLSENAVYIFRVLATNDVGTVYTDNITLYTTDVQDVTVVSTDGRTLIRVQCDFITGSDAQGCVVVLVGNFNETLNLTRPENASDVSETYMFNLEYTISCFMSVLAYDIEKDGSIGSLAIYGEIHKNVSTLEMSKCTPQPSNEHDMSLTLIIAIIVLLVLLILSLAVFLAVILTVTGCRINRSKAYCVSQSQDITLAPTQENSNSQEAIYPLYDLPSQNVNNKQNNTGKTIDNYNRTRHTAFDHVDVPDGNSVASAQLPEEDHMYHVLECRTQETAYSLDEILPDPDAPELPPPYVPDVDGRDSTREPPQHFYHELNELSQREK